MMMKTAILMMMMMMMVGLSTAYSTASLGDRLLSPFNQLTEQPVTASEAKAANYLNSNSSCDSNLGIAYTYKGVATTATQPLTYYYTASGYLAGVGVDLFHTTIASSAPIARFWQPVASQQYRLIVSFRAPSAMCNPSFSSSETLGDRVVINQHLQGGYPLPVVEKEAVLANFTAGGCINQMGTHYAYDLTSAPAMSWVADNMLPIVLMFNGGSINAVFFASSDVQQTLGNPHHWDGISLTNALMCLNWCDADCHWVGTSGWSTMHWIFNAADAAQCATRC